VSSIGRQPRSRSATATLKLNLSQRQLYSFMSSELWTSKWSVLDFVCFFLFVVTNVNGSSTVSVQSVFVTAIYDNDNYNNNTQIYNAHIVCKKQNQRRR